MDMIVRVDDTSKSDVIAEAIARILNEHGGGQVVYRKHVVCRSSGEATPVDAPEFTDL